MKSLIVTKIVQKMDFEEAWSELEVKNFPETIMDNIYETGSGSHVK